MTGDLPSIVARQGPGRSQSTENLGCKVVYDRKYGAAGESELATFVEDMKEKGIKILEFIGEPANLVGARRRR